MFARIKLSSLSGCWDSLAVNYVNLYSLGRYSFYICVRYGQGFSYDLTTVSDIFKDRGEEKKGYR